MFAKRSATTLIPNTGLGSGRLLLSPAHPPLLLRRTVTLRSASDAASVCPAVTGGASK